MSASFSKMLSLILAVGVVNSVICNSAAYQRLCHAAETHPIVVPEGFTIELVAAPPLVKHPTFATFDDRGRLYLSENAGVNLTAEELQKQLPNSIRMLEDTDGDGHYDRSTLFADKMTFPMGGAWHQGALYVASPPYIWRLEDTDGDGIADKREQLVGTFGDTGNASSVHGCLSGPDGRLYWTDGYHGHEFRDAAGNLTSKREGSYLFSCRPDGSDVMLHCGGGMDNPVEVDFTSSGEMLGTVNILYTRPRVDAFVHWLYGGAYPHRERVLKEIQVTGELLGPIHRFGHVAVSGTLRYRSGAFDEQWKDNFFTTFFNTGKVVRLEVERSGSTFTATQREFLSCADRDFHPTDIIEDADGSLLVVNTGGWFYRGCPTSQHAKPEISGGIYRVRRTGMPVPNDPRGSLISWESLSAEELVKLLDDPRFMVRERAMATCAERGDAVTPFLEKMVTSSSALARLNAVWSLVRMGKGGALLPFLNDSELDVRLAALHGLSFYPDSGATKKVIELLNSDHPALRRASAVTLGRNGDAEVIPALLQSLAKPLERPEEHAVIYALIELNQPEKTRPGLQAENLQIQRGALIALDQMTAGDLQAQDVLPLIESRDVELRKAGAKIFIRHNDWSSQAAGLLEQLLKNQQQADENSEIIESLVNVFVHETAVARTIGEALADSTLPAVSRQAIFKGIAARRGLALHPGWIAPLEENIKNGNEKQLDLVLNAIAAIKTEQFHAQLRELADNDQQPVLLRVRALQVVSGQRGTLPDSAFSMLDEVLSKGGPQERLAIAQRIGSSSLNPSQLIQMTSHFERASPSEIKELIRPFNHSRSDDVAQAFINGLKSALNFTSLSENEVSDIVKEFPAKWLPEGNQLIDQLKAHRQKQITLLDTLLPTLKEGDAQRGAAIFFSEQAKCSACHRVGSKGENIGPDLSMIGANRSGSDLLESIIFPSATIVRDYEPYMIMTEDGRVLTGLVARETSDVLYLQQQNGEVVPIQRNQIEEMVPGTVSIMPAGLEKVLTTQQLADLVAYLKNLNQPSVISSTKSE